jgi:hypothetical protein
MGQKISFVPGTNLELAMLGLNLRTVEKMDRKDSLSKQMLIHLTEDEFNQIQTACKQASMKQSDYLRHKLLSTSAVSFIPSNDIHNVRLLGLMLTKIFEKLNDTQIIDPEVMEISQLVDEIKITVRKLNDKLNKG